MSLEEKVLESVRNLKAMAEQCIDLATKVAEEVTKEVKKENHSVLKEVSVGTIKTDQFFVYEGKLYQKRDYGYVYVAADGTKRKLIQGLIKNKDVVLRSGDDADIHNFDSMVFVHLVV